MGALASRMGFERMQHTEVKQSGERGGVSPIPLTLSGMALATGDVEAVFLRDTGG